MSGNVNLSEASLIDNIFEGRNKSYGAYELRTNSSKRTLIALILSSIFFIGMVYTAFLLMKKKDVEEVKITKVELKKVKTPIKKEEKKILEQKKEEPIKKVKSVVDIVKNVPPVVVNKKTVENDIPPVDPDKKSGSETAKGDATANLDKGVELAKEEQQGDDTDYNAIFTSVQVQAAPPGGMNAFRKQIASSFRLPEVDETTTGTVIAKFVVWDDGSIRDIQIVKESPAGLGLGKEATRILSKSPKWTPGIYNGRSVKQYYTLPISIQITANE
ncbi:energy transducer TonB [Flavobacterium facile]|uniref:energy transducer TonB n=1 Tax=Flavobacterium facile TaxID=2893174 RepID=UPI002E7A3C6D|nr:energy transducer TonB [Flavobacterium sp. T-12]